MYKLIMFLKNSFAVMSIVSAVTRPLPHHSFPFSSCPGSCLFASPSSPTWQHSSLGSPSVLCLPPRHGCGSSHGTHSLDPLRTCPPRLCYEPSHTSHGCMSTGWHLWTSVRGVRRHLQRLLPEHPLLLLVLCRPTPTFPSPLHPWSLGPSPGPSSLNLPKGSGRCRLVIQGLPLPISYRRLALLSRRQRHPYPLHPVLLLGTCISLSPLVQLAPI